ncbi:MAG: hypothetical protein R6V00_00825 [Candidatus Aminicenantes bacterium]
MFSIISSISILALIAFFLYHSYKKQKNISNFQAWLIHEFTSLFKPTLKKRLKNFYQKKINSFLSKTAQVISGSLFFCFVYLFGSGFYFALFSTRRMYGLPLMFHMIFGCFFALLMCAVLILYAKKFDFLDQEKEKKHKFLPNVKDSLFWLFVLSGLSLITTSLLMMIPIFIYQTQLVMFEVHRYSALVSVLSALGFLYTSFSKNEKTQK